MDQKIDNYTIVPNSIIFDKNLSPYDLKIYLYLLSCTNEKRDGEKIAFPSLNTIKDKLNISKRTVQDSINKLIELGYISNIDLKKTMFDSAYGTNHYIVNLEPTPNQEFITKRKQASKNIGAKIKERKTIANNATVDNVEVWQEMSEGVAPNATEVWQEMPPNNTNLTILNNNIKEKNSKEKFLSEYKAPQNWLYYYTPTLDKYYALDESKKAQVDKQIASYKELNSYYTPENIISVIEDGLKDLERLKA